jgi:endonuclease-3 related protein
MSSQKLQEIYDLLYDYFKEQKWWPGDSPFEIMTGAVLTQNTNWKNVEKAIDNLKNADMLNPFAIDRCPAEKLSELIRPAGYFNVKTKRLKNLIKWFIEDYQGQIENIEGVSTSSLKEDLLNVSGIGPETADSILLYALNRPVFVIDTYTARMAIRHQLVEHDADYFQLQEFFESNLTEDTQLFNEYHALIVCLGKQFCKPKPKCDKCPLNILPHSLENEYYC